MNTHSIGFGREHHGFRMESLPHIWGYGSECMKNIFYAPESKDWGHTVVLLSIHLSVSSLVCKLNITSKLFNSYQMKKTLDFSKLKAFVDDNLNVTNVRFFFESFESIVGKEENAGHQHFWRTIVPQCYRSLRIT